jgi:pyrroline-5-carboxylate reductase
VTVTVRQPAVLAIVGGGNMARALVEGCAKSGASDLAPDRLVIAEPDAGRRAALEGLGAFTVHHAHELATRIGPETQILLAVKPQSLSAAAKDLGGMADHRVVISILAGVPSERVRAEVGVGARIIRAMARPAPPSRWGRGPDPAMRRWPTGCFMPSGLLWSI